MTVQELIAVPPRFSHRTAWDRTPTEFAAAMDAAKAAGSSLIDLTNSNPTACGFPLSAASLLRPLTDPAGLHYAPASAGLLSARQAVSDYYARRGSSIAADQIVLTASTSEAYSHLLRLLCDSGEEVLVAQPGYPLLDYLADLSDVRLKHYQLFYDHGWWIDRAELEARITEHTRAIVVVHPNNPTGHAASSEDRMYLQTLCGQHGLSLIVDEVFIDYPHAVNDTLTSFCDGEAPVLTFVLNGLSKIAALPQMKVGWIVARGPDQVLEEALVRLDIIADTFLSVNTPAQFALSRWLHAAPNVQHKILERIATNLQILRDAGLEILQLQAGWSAILKLPRLFGEKDASAALLSVGVLTHPADFFGLRDPGSVVVSLIVPVEQMELGAQGIRHWIDGSHAKQAQAHTR